MLENQILYASQDNQFIIKLVGEIRYTMSNDLNAIITEAFKHSHITSFIIDLSNTIFIDSTNLGLIAKIARLAKKKDFKIPVIFSTNENVNIVLKSMGFDEIFILIEELQQNFDHINLVLAQEIHNNVELKQLVFEAHRILFEMNDRNREKFRNVVELLGRENNTH